ncbi:MAG TPA: hypothetical protein VGK85_03335 [Myxococcaceae bacterium]
MVNPPELVHDRGEAIAASEKRQRPSPSERLRGREEPSGAGVLVLKDVPGLHKGAGNSDASLGLLRGQMLALGKSPLKGPLGQAQFAGELDSARKPQGGGKLDECLGRNAPLA